MAAITRPIKKGSYLRLRLFDQLDRTREKPMIWVSAPAGSGKTTLVSSYSETRNLPCLWYQCDRDDADPATFFYGMGLAAARAVPGRRKSLPLFTPEYQQGISTFTRNYFQDLYKRIKKPSLIVFDNYQDIGDDAVFPDILNTAVAYLPEGINIIVISRHDPPDFLIRLQANSAMEVLYWRDIRLAEDEVRGMADKQSKAPYPENYIRSLYRITDGWAAGVVLIMATHKNPDNPVHFEKQSSDEIMAYFAQEIFSHLDPNLQDFFARTSFLPKMTARMATEITGEPSAADILRQINKQNYFISRHGYTDPLYEYHPLYRDFLQAQAKKLLSPDQFHELRIKAANLLEQNGQTGPAIALLREAAQWQTIALIIIARARDMLNEGRHLLLREWVESLPPDVIQGIPWLLFFRAMSMLPFAPVEARTHFEEAFGRFRKQQDNIGAALSACGAIHAIVLGYDNFAPLDHWRIVLNELAQSMGPFPDGEVEAMVMCSLVVASSWREFYSPETEVWEQRTFGIPETAATINAKSQALCFVFWRRLIYKGPPDALPVLNELRRMAGARDTGTLIFATAQLAEVQYYLSTGRHDELVAAAQEGLDIAEKTGVHVLDIWFYLFIIMSCNNRMDYTSAGSWLDKIRNDPNVRPNWPGSTYHLLLSQVAIFRKDYTLALYEGEEGLNSAAKSGSPFSIAMNNLSMAYICHILGRHHEAIEHLERARSYASERNSKATMIVVLLYHAQFAFDEGDETKGLSLLAQSIALARECEIALHMT